MALCDIGISIRELRLWALLAALGFVVGLAAACGGADAPSAVGSTPQSASERPAPAERSTEAARPAAVSEAAKRTPGNDAAAALEASRPRREQGDRAATSDLEACRRLAEENPDEAAAILDACKSDEAERPISTTSVVAINVNNPAAVGPPYVSMRGVGNGALPLRLGPQEYRCEITVTQHRTDAAAGGFSVTFSGDDLLAQTVEVEGPSWTGEAMLPAGGEGIREVELAVRADATDAEWRVACSQGSG